MTLTDFLLARIDEDEVPLAGIVQGEGDPDFFWGPDRIRAECEAKRRIVERCVSRVEDIDDLPLTGANIGADVLRALALPYADHPDYRDGWRP